MLRDLFINMAILISFISLGSQISKKYEINQSSTIKIRVIFGIITAFLGIILMLFTVKLDNKTLVDFRNIAILIASYFGGAVSVIVCGLMTALFRIIYFGVSSSSLYAFASILLITIGCIFIGKTNVRDFKKWIILVLYSLIISNILFIILLNGESNLLNFLLFYCIITIAVAIMVFNYINYCFEANLYFRRLKTESTKDYLTGLNNVRQFDTSFNTAVNHAIRKNESLSLLMIDIDFFKKVNDTYGHSQGDIVLIELGKILLDSCRSYDIVSRNGGEEFTVLLVDCHKNEAFKIAEKIRKNVEEHDFILENQKKIKVTVSIGLAAFPESTKEYEKLLEMSDMALYNAKRSGRNKVCTI